jgi:murein L,D-transpeptidase YcbB/YkuD
MRALARSSAHGLDPEAYHWTALRSQRLRRSAAERGQAARPRARLALLSYASDLAYGRLDPREIRPDWQSTRRPRDLALVLDAALASNRLESALEELAPAQPGYKALGAALLRYREIAARGGWPLLQAPPRPPHLRNRARAAGAPPGCRRRLSTPRTGA